MSFINENVGFLATSGTGVMRTTNGGASWDFTLIGDYDYLYGIYALNQNSIIAISESGGIWNSSNGGVTFTNLQTFSNEYFQYSTISFADDEVGYISGDDGFLMRTANKGLTWDLVTLPVVTSYKRVKFFDAQLGWLVGSGGKAMKTVDGGLTWTDRSTGSFYGLIDIFIGDPTHLWSVATIGRIYKSTDGNSWVEVTTPTTQNLNKVAFYDLLNGMAVGYNGVILKTTDGGDNWTLLSSGVTSIINTIIYLSSDTLIAGTVNGKILRTVNNGQTWSTISLPVNREVRSIIKTDSDTIYVFTNVGQSIISTDKGLTWTLQKRFTACNLREVTRTPSGDLYVCGSNGMIMTTAQSNVGITEFLNSTYQTLLLFPNPTTDIIHYPIKIQDKITYQIYDLQGRLVQAGFVEGNSMKINQLPTGTYIVHSKVDQKQYVSKIVKN